MEKKAASSHCSKDIRCTLLPLRTPPYAYSQKYAKKPNFTLLTLQVQVLVRLLVTMLFLLSFGFVLWTFSMQPHVEGHNYAIVPDEKFSNSSANQVTKSQTEILIPRSENFKIVSNASDCASQEKLRRMPAMNVSDPVHPPLKSDLKTQSENKNISLELKSTNGTFANNLIEIIRYLKHGPNPHDIGPSSTYPISLTPTAPNVFVRYLIWHAKEMNCVRSKECYKQRRTRIKLLVWKCPDNLQQCQGTGDRMRGLITTLAFAMITKRVFLLQWPENPFPFIHAVAPAALDWRVPQHVDHDIDVQRWGVAHDSKYRYMQWLKCPLSYTCIDQNELNVSSDSMMKRRLLNREVDMRSTDLVTVLSRVGSFVMQSRGTYAPHFYTRPEWHKLFPDKRFHMPPTPSHYISKLLLRALFKPSPVTERMMKSFISEHARKEGYVAIHVRTGHDVGEMRINRFDAYRNLSNKTIATRFVECARNMTISHQRYVFFASDSLPLKREFALAGKEAGLMVMFSDMMASHVGQRKGGVASSDVEDLFGNEQWKGFLNVFAEFFAVANGSTIISGKSEFSRMASLLSNSTSRKGFNPFSSSPCDPSPS